MCIAALSIVFTAIFAFSLKDVLTTKTSDLSSVSFVNMVFVYCIQRSHALTDRLMR